MRVCSHMHTHTTVCSYQVVSARYKSYALSAVFKLTYILFKLIYIFDTHNVMWKTAPCFQSSVLETFFFFFFHLSRLFLLSSFYCPLVLFVFRIIKYLSNFALPVTWSNSIITTPFLLLSYKIVNPIFCSLFS